MNRRVNRNAFTNIRWTANLAVLLCLLMPSLVRAADDNAEETRVKASGEVLKELLNGPNGVPLDLLKTWTSPFGGEVK